MLKLALPIMMGAAVLAASLPAGAADLYQPPVVEAPPPVYVPEPAPAFSGWYIRGDAGYNFYQFRGGDWITYGCALCGPTPGTNSFTSGTLRGAFSLGGGVGYQVTNHFRVDLTGDYFFKAAFRGSSAGTGCGAGPCTSTDASTMSALLLMANAYADLGTWHGITPYLGAGLGGARISWGDLENTTTGTAIHTGSTNWRFAWALMAGASYCVTDKLKLDVGYRYARVAGGRMFEWGPAGAAIGAGPGFDRGIDIHQVRGGLRYSFGGDSTCAPRDVVSYEPPQPLPIYK
ncbi:MAG: porin family protein [Rhizobiales bacterium]|jgi:opacity protein-like surface antigen|nr:porin family protein [Hyphomicrobiales bacterium]